MIFEFFFWLIIFYIIMKALGVFLKFFLPAYRGKSAARQRQKPEQKYESKFKDAEEVDFIEIKEDKNSKEKKS